MKYLTLLKEKLKRAKESLKSEKIKNLFSFILETLFYGLLLNYAVFGVFGVRFTWYTFPAYGLLFYFITEEFVIFIRRVTAK